MICFSICSILSKVEDLASGLSQFSLKVNTSSPIEEVISSLHLKIQVYLGLQTGARGFAFGIRGWYNSRWQKPIINHVGFSWNTAEMFQMVKGTESLTQNH